MDEQQEYTNEGRKDNAAKEISHAAARFISQESNRQSLITVTHTDISPDSAVAVIYVSVLPESAEEQALHFLKRIRGDFRQWIKKEVRLRRIPQFDFVIDIGEKHRQDVERVSQKYRAEEERRD